MVPWGCQRRVEPTTEPGLSSERDRGGGELPQEPMHLPTHPQLQRSASCIFHKVRCYTLQGGEDR